MNRTGRKSDRNEKFFPNRRRFFRIFLLPPAKPVVRISKNFAQAIAWGDKIQIGLPTIEGLAQIPAALLT